MGELLTRAEAAARAGIHTNTFDKHVAAGKITPASQVGEDGWARYDSEEVDAAFRLRPAPSAAADEQMRQATTTGKLAEILRKDGLWTTGTEGEWALIQQYLFRNGIALLGKLQAELKLEKAAEATIALVRAASPMLKPSKGQQGNGDNEEAEADDQSERKALLEELKQKIAEMKDLEEALEKANAAARAGTTPDKPGGAAAGAVQGAAGDGSGVHAGQGVLEP